MDLSPVSLRNDWIWILALFISMVAFWCLTAYRFAATLRLCGVQLSMKEWLGLTVATRLLNYLLPFKSGVLLKIAYLKQCHCLAYAAFGVIGLTAGVLAMTVNSMLLIALLLAMTDTGTLGRYAFGGAVAALTVGTAVIATPRLLRNISPFRRLRQIVVGVLREIQAKPAGVIAVTGLQFLVRAAYAIAFVSAFTLAGADLHYLQTAVISVLVGMSMVVTLTPGNLGVSEGIIVTVAVLYGSTAADAMVAAGLIRMMELLVLAVGGLLFGWRFI
ncbi:lysylphosphatidylglycerol synthase transmembrane domain-containing protein, partial [Thiohalocapsa halophila]